MTKKTVVSNQLRVLIVALVVYFSSCTLCVRFTPRRFILICIFMKTDFSLLPLWTRLNSNSCNYYFTYILHILVSETK